MNRFKQHIPSFVEMGDDLPPEFDFTTTDELLASEIVRGYAKPDAQFVMSGPWLMIVTDRGFHWWVVGSVSDPSAMDLPQWDGGKYRAELADGKQVTLTKEVASSCGNVLTLRDGTIARNIKAFGPSDGVPLDDITIKTFRWEVSGTAEGK